MIVTCEQEEGIAHNEWCRVSCEFCLYDWQVARIGLIADKEVVDSLVDHGNERNNGHRGIRGRRDLLILVDCSLKPTEDESVCFLCVFTVHKFLRIGESLGERGIESLVKQFLSRASHHLIHNRIAHSDIRRRHEIDIMYGSRCAERGKSETDVIVGIEHDVREVENGTVLQVPQQQLMSVFKFLNGLGSSTPIACTSPHDAFVGTGRHTFGLDHKPSFIVTEIIGVLGIELPCNVVRATTTVVRSDRNGIGITVVGECRLMGTVVVGGYHDGAIVSIAFAHGCCCCSKSQREDAKEEFSFHYFNVSSTKL